jgi:bleomycin hydrolase
MADAAIARRSGMKELRKQVGELLDHEIGYMPRYVHMLGAEYTSLEFGHSVCMPDEYVALTSFTHHPFGQQFALEVPDNQLHDVFLNVSCDTLMLCIERSLRAGHPVCWEGDLSEDGFSFKKGVGELSVPDSQTDAVQKQRQREFERFQTTDDHCMTLVGIAHDQQGKRYYIAKNSWGENNPYKGLVYLSEDYVRIKTIAAVVLREMAEQVLGKTDLELDE